VVEDEIQVSGGFRGGCSPAPDGVRSPTVVAPARIVFFEKPSGWLIREETLRAFRKDAEYRVNGGSRNVGPVEFTAARPRQLAPVAALTAVGYHRQHVVSEVRFEKLAQKDCDGP
jgi:hypothetical protein